MTALEKLVKSLDTLKNLQLSPQVSDEHSARRKEKISSCVSIADTLCNTSLKQSPHVAHLLTPSIESLLQLCDDKDSNVHMVAEESLNRIIRSVTDNNVVKIQLELYKEMKRNRNPRSLRAALSRFAQLSHLIKPNKGKAYVANLIPCLVQISNRPEEAVQETLAASLPLILKALGMFTTDKDIKELLKAFLQNLSSENALIRRTAASCILCLCRSSRKPQVFLSYVVSTLLDVISVREGTPVSEMLGVLGCLRAVLPATTTKQMGAAEQGRPGARPRKESELGVDSFLKVLSLALDLTRHSDHNVINAALELLLLLVQSPPNELLPLLVSPHGIKASQDPLPMRSLSQLSVAGDDLDVSSVTSETSMLEPWPQDSVGEGYQAPQLQLMDISERPPLGDLTAAEMKDASSHALPLFSQIPLDADTDADTPLPSAGLSYSSLTRSPSASSQGEVRYQVCDIGTLTDGSVALVFCARHIATSFLLAGHSGFWIPDRAVRVSVKALALSCIAAIVRLLPNTFQLFLDRDPGLDSLNSASQPICELLLYAKHTDPQLRAVCLSLVASLVRAVLVQSGGNWSSWQNKADGRVSPLLALDRLVDMLLQGFRDESSTTCRLTLAAVTPMLPVLLESQDRDAGIPLLHALPALATNPYWLVKVKLAEMISELPMLAVHEAAGPDMQNRLIQDALLLLVGDEDARVRKAAAEAFKKLVRVLFFPVDHEGRDVVMAKAFHLVDAQLGPLLADASLPGHPSMGPLDSLVPPFDAWSAHLLAPEKPKMLRIHEAALSRIVHLLSSTLYQCSSKYLSLGCCEVLSVLSVEYPPTVYQSAWGCSLGNPKTSGRRERKKSIEGSLPCNRLLGAAMALLLSNPIAVELSAQQQLLILAGNLVCGSAVAAMITSSPSQQWSLFKDKQHSTTAELAEALLQHVLRVLNVIVHVVDEVSHSAKSSLMGQSLSPIKKHGSIVNSKTMTSTSFDSALDAKISKGISPIKNVISHDEKDEKSDEKRCKNAAVGAFSHLPHYVKIHDVIKSAYSSYKVSLTPEANEKLERIVRSVLMTLSGLLEVMAVQEVEKVAEELLTLLRSVMCLAPDQTVVCVNQLLKCLVGMNLSALWGEVANSFEPSASAQPEQFDCSKESSKNGKSYYQICFQEPAQKLEKFLRSVVERSLDPCDPGNYLKWMNMTRRRSDSKLSHSGGHNADMTYLASYIRLFEPMVIESMQQYRITNDVNLQCKVLTLLTQLVNLRINYCLLDSEKIFIKHIFKQFEFIEEGKVPQADELVSKIFHFLVLLSFEKQHSKSITTIPHVIQLCDTLMASEQDPLTHCIPALVPVVEHVFLSRYGAELSIDAKELETQRDVLVARLLKLIEYHQVMEMISLVLKGCRLWADGEEQWRRWSSQVADVLIPMMAERRLRLDSLEAHRALRYLVLHAMDPAALHPVDPLLRVLFAPPPSADCGVTSTICWLGGIDVALLTVLSEEREAATLACLEELKLAIHCGLARSATASATSEGDRASPDPLTAAITEVPPQLVMARLLIRVAGLAAERIASLVLDPAASQETLNQCQLLQQLLAHFLLTIIHMLQSGSHCQMVSAAIQLVCNPTTEDALLLEDANATLLQLAPACPVLVVLWCTMLTLVSYSSAAFWTRALQPESEEDTECQTRSINRRIVQDAATVVYCDYVCENPGEAEQVTWLLSSHAFRLVALSSEPPVQQLIAAAHRSRQNSQVFLQAVSNVIPLFNKASVLKRLLRCLAATHPALSGSLLRLAVHQLLWQPHVALARRAAVLCSLRADHLLLLPPADVAQQLPKDQLCELMDVVQRAHHHRKHSALLNVLAKLGSQCFQLPPPGQEKNPPSSCVAARVTGPETAPETAPETSRETVPETAPETAFDAVPATGGRAPTPVPLDRTWYLGQVALRCSGSAYAVEESALLVGRLDFQDAVSILSSPETPLSILQHCFRHGVYLTLHAGDARNSNEDSSEEQLSPLYRASKHVLFKLLRQLKEGVSISRQAASEAECPFRKCDKDSLFQMAGATIWYLKSLPLLLESVPFESAEDLAYLAIRCLEAVGLDGERASHLEIGLECADRVIGQPIVSRLLEEPQRSDWLVSACCTLFKLVKSFVCQESVPEVPDGGLSESCFSPETATVCSNMASLVVWLENHQFNRATRNIPKFLRSIFRSLVIRLSRFQALLINSFVCIPPDAWRHGLTLPFNESMTSLPPVPTPYLQDMDILRQFVFRVTLLGWRTRLQFEETWMSLLSVLGAQANLDETTSPDEVTIIAQAKTVAIEAISALLLQTLVVPVPGDPNSSHLLHIPRDRPIIHTPNSGTAKLKTAQELLAWKVERIEGTKPYTVFDRPNLDHLSDPKRFSYGQVSVEYLRYSMAAAQGFVSKEVISDRVSEAHAMREMLLQESGLDVNSCLHFLLELFVQWTQTSAPVNTGAVNIALNPSSDAFRAALTVSDLFTEASQWQWLLDTGTSLSASQPAEDDSVHQYVVLAQCKACAVLEPSIESCERVRRALEAAMRSPSSATRCSALHGLLYLLQTEWLKSLLAQDASPCETEADTEHKTLLVNLATNYVMKHAKTIASSGDETHSILVWTLAMYLLDNLASFETDVLHQSVVCLIEQAVSLACPSNGAPSPTLRQVIIQGLERLVVSQSEALTDSLFEEVTQLAVKSLKEASPCELLPSLQLFLSCMYIGMNRLGEERNKADQLSPGAERSDRSDIDLAEKVVSAMEKISVLFERIKKGYPLEVELVCAVLPSLLTDFFPALEVLTKVVGEFLSPQQPHPRLLAAVVFQVFERAVAQNQLALLQDWVVTSLADFTHSLPLPMASWCITCFFISASCNPWLRALFPHVQSRIGRCEPEDRRLVCLAAEDFYQQLSERQQEMFFAKFQAAVKNQPNSPFSALIIR